jgi:hypothetical protein
MHYLQKVTLLHNNQMHSRFINLFQPQQQMDAIDCFAHVAWRR